MSGKPVKPRNNWLLETFRKNLIKSENIMVNWSQGKFREKL